MFRPWFYREKNPDRVEISLRWNDRGETRATRVIGKSADLINASWIANESSFVPRAAPDASENSTSMRLLNRANVWNNYTGIAWISVNCSLW